MNGDDVTPLVLTKADAEPGWEPPPDAVIRIQMRLSRMPIESPARFADERQRVQAEEAERLAEVLADTLPEGTVQRLVGFLLVRTAGVRMGIAPLGDPRAADRGASRPQGLRGQTCPNDGDHAAHVWTSTLVEPAGEPVWCLGQPATRPR